MEFVFVWDARKASENKRKHGVSFDEALSVFGDRLSITIDDPDHSDREMRMLQVGLSLVGRVLVVAFTERDHEIRIISARPATKNERRQYEEGH